MGAPKAEHISWLTSAFSTGDAHMRTATPGPYVGPPMGPRYVRGVCRNGGNAHMQTVPRGP
eukprot:5349226-Pyramimonas_sp.AAC.1